MKDLRRLLTLFGEYRRDLFLAMGFVLIETFSSSSSPCSWRTS